MIKSEELYTNDCERFTRIYCLEGHIDRMHCKSLGGTFVSVSHRIEGENWVSGNGTSFYAWDKHMYKYPARLIWDMQMERRLFHHELKIWAESN